MKGGGKRRVSRLGLRADPPAVPRWPAPLLALLAILACGLGGANSAFLSVLAAQGSFLLAAAIFLSARLPRLSPVAVLPVVGALLAYLAWAALPGLGQAAPLLAPDRFWPAWLEAASLVVAFLAAATTGLRRGNVERFALWLTGFTGLLILATLGLRLAGAGGTAPFAIEDDRLHRFAGSIGNPNVAGVAYAMLSLMAVAMARVKLARWVQKPGDGRLLLALGALLVALASMALVGITQSRTALALLMAGLLVQWLSRKPGARRWRGWRAVAMGGAALCLMLGLLLVAGTTLDRFAPLEADGVSRVAIWRYYCALAQEAPLTGYGLGSFVELNQRHLTPLSAPELWSFGAAHAAPLQISLESGWPGLALLAGVAVLVGRGSARLLRGGADPLGQAMALAVLVALMAGMVDIALNVPGIALLASILAGLGWGRALRNRV